MRHPRRKLPRTTATVAVISSARAERVLLPTRVRSIFGRRSTINQHVPFRHGGRGTRYAARKIAVERDYVVTDDGSYFPLLGIPDLICILSSNNGHHRRGYKFGRPPRPVSWWPFTRLFHDLKTSLQLSTESMN